MDTIYEISKAGQLRGLQERLHVRCQKGDLWVVEGGFNMIPIKIKIKWTKNRMRIIFKKSIGRLKDAFYYSDKEEGQVSGTVLTRTMCLKVH